MEDRDRRAPAPPGGGPYRERLENEEADEPDVESYRADLVAWIACAVVAAGAFVERGRVGGVVSLALLAVAAIAWGARHELRATGRRVIGRLRRSSPGKR
jgi:hypothetical protein